MPIYPEIITLYLIIERETSLSLVNFQNVTILHNRADLSLKPQSEFCFSAKHISIGC